MQELMLQLSLDIFAVIMLGYMLYLMGKIQAFSQEKAWQYDVAVVIILILVLLECATTILEFFADSQNVVPLMLVNMIGFALTPLAPIVLAFLFDPSLKQKAWNVLIPIIIYMVICLTSPFTGFIFIISTTGVYSRGPFFGLAAIAGIYALVILCVANFRSGKIYEKKDKQVILSILLLVIGGNGIQLVLPMIHAIWPASAFAILLYYIFMRNMQYKLDPLTEIYNRGNFQNRMKEDSEEITNLIVIMDLNNLKKVNDTYGHMEGDQFIKDAAYLIQNSFMDAGQAYRIGGDEFCVLCNIKDDKKFQKMIADFQNSVNQHEMVHEIPFGISFGYAKVEDRDQSLYDTFNRADREMYHNKQRVHL